LTCGECTRTPPPTLTRWGQFVTTRRTTTNVSPLRDHPPRPVLERDPAPGRPLAPVSALCRPHRSGPGVSSGAVAYGGVSPFRKPGAEQGPGTSGGVWTLPLGVTTVVCPTLGGGPGGKLPNEVQSWVTWPGTAEAGVASASAATSAVMTTTRRRLIGDSPFWTAGRNDLAAPFLAQHKPRQGSEPDTSARPPQPG
jgi:hypothetical protein